MNNAEKNGKSNTAHSLPIHPTTPNQKHLIEWQKSGISDELIESNLISIEGNAVYEAVFDFTEPDRRNDGRLRDKDLKRYEDPAKGGWIFYTIDVATGEKSDFFQFKPDEPHHYIEKDSGKEKIIKYETPKGGKASEYVLALAVGLKTWQKIGDRAHVPPSCPIGLKNDHLSIQYYQWLRDHPSVPLLITEGSKKTGCGLTAGYATIGLTGHTMGCKKNDEQACYYLNPQLEILCKGREIVIFGMDQDEKAQTQKQVSHSVARMAGCIKAVSPDTQVLMTKWKPEHGKGIDDLVFLQGEEFFHKIISKAKSVVAISPEHGFRPSTEAYQKNEHNSEKIPFNGAKKRLVSDNDLKVRYLMDCLGQLRFNELTKAIEEDDKPIKNLHLIYMREDIRNCWLSLGQSKEGKEQYRHLPIGRDFAAAATEYEAKKNAYHPVKEYLERVRENVSPLSSHEWENIAFTLLGCPDKLSSIILRRSLISAVARIYEPGCLIRLVPILKGGQGGKKTTFWRILAGEDFFSDSLGNLQNIKDDYMSLHSSWILEWGEIEKITRRREAEDLKAFITKCFDDFRLPYGRIVERHPRMQLLVGTTNAHDFLPPDPSGNTRYGVIEVPTRIDIEKIMKLREQVWASAISDYLKGEQWWLTDEEVALSEDNNRNFERVHPWQEIIEKYLEERQDTCARQIAEQCLNIEISRRSVADNRTISDCLTRLGFIQDKNKTKYHDWGRIRVWRRVTTEARNPNVGLKEAEVERRAVKAEIPESTPEAIAEGSAPTATTLDVRESAMTLPTRTEPVFSPLVTTKSLEVEKNDGMQKSQPENLNHGSNIYEESNNDNEHPLYIQSNEEVKGAVTKTPPDTLPDRKVIGTTAKGHFSSGLNGSSTSSKSINTKHQFKKGDQVWFQTNKETIYIYIGWSIGDRSYLIKSPDGKAWSCQLSDLSLVQKVL